MEYANILRHKYPGTIWTLRVQDDYGTLEWHDGNTVPKPSKEELEFHDAEVKVLVEWDRIRERRNKLLRASDWSQLVDVPKATQTKWKKYRHELRELPQFFDDPDFVVFPEKPE